MSARVCGCTERTSARRRPRDGVWAVASPEVYLLLVEDAGWTPDEYEAFIAGVLESVVPRS